MVKKLEINMQESEPIRERSTLVDTPRELEKEKGFWAKIFKKEKVKQGMVAVLFLKVNGGAEPMYLTPDKKGFFIINNTHYHEEEDCTYFLGKDRVPLAIIRERGLIPEGTHQFYKKIKDADEKIKVHQDLAIRAIRHAELVRQEGAEGMKMNPKIVIGLIVIGVIALALFKDYI